MNKHFTVRTITFSALLLAPSLALADAVGSKPLQCPPGTHLVTNHYGSDCAPDQCPAGSEPSVCDGHGCCRAEICLLPEGKCDDGLACNVTRLCAKPGLPAPNDRYREIVGSCEDGTKCAAGSRCEVIASCVPKKKGTLSKCSCDLAEPNPDKHASLFACALLLGAYFLRSSRRRERLC